MAMPLMCPVTPQTMTEKYTSLLPHNRPKSAHGQSEFFISTAISDS